MEKLLIVNADDFGLCKGQNYGIIDAFRNGVVSSTTAMMNSVDINHAAELSAQYPALPVGMHFVLTFGRPLTAMPSLTDANGELGKWLWQRAGAGTLDLNEIAQELECQFERFSAVFGRPPTHIDSHHHVHMLPQIYPLVAAFARENHSRCVLIDMKCSNMGSLSITHVVASGLTLASMVRTYQSRRSCSYWNTLINKALTRWKLCVIRPLSIRR